MSRPTLRDRLLEALEKADEIRAALDEVDTLAVALSDRLYHLAEDLEEPSAFDQAVEHARAAGRLGPRGEA